MFVFYYMNIKRIVSLKVFDYEDVQLIPINAS